MKERLTGAIILVVLVVLLVPELLSGPKGPAAIRPATRAASPSSEEPPLRSYTINLGDDSHSQSQTANGAADTSAPPQPSGPAQPTVQAGTPQGGTPGNDISESSTWDSTATTSEQPGSSVTGNASSAPTSTAAQKPTAASRPVTSTAAPPTSKPSQSPPAIAAKATQPTAPAVASKSTSTSAAAARAEASKPARTASAEAGKSTRATAAEKQGKGQGAATGRPSTSEAGAWGVQLGVFASRENAERLALQVRVKGFKASVSPVTSGKRKLYRVRVGPAPDRSAAQELQARLKAAGRPGGTVVPYS